MFISNNLFSQFSPILPHNGERGQGGEKNMESVEKRNVMEELKTRAPRAKIVELGQLRKMLSLTHIHKAMETIAEGLKTETEFKFLSDYAMARIVQIRGVLRDYTELKIDREGGIMSEKVLKIYNRAYEKLLRKGKELTVDNVIRTMKRIADKILNDNEYMLIIKIDDELAYVFYCYEEEIYGRK